MTDNATSELVGSTTNTVRDSEVGTAVQARSINGGIHVHHATPPSTPRPRVPHELPLGSPHFTDRQKYLAALDQQRNSRNPTAPQIIVISGVGGVGKTALAAHWLRHRPAREFPDGQLYADLRGFGGGNRPTPDEVLRALLRSLGYTDTPSTLPELAALWRSVTDQLRFGLLLDNAADAHQVRPLLPAAPGALVVVTSRHRLAPLIPDGATLHQLPPLDRPAALNLLRSVAGPGRLAAEQLQLAGEIAGLCVGLPLALCLTGAYLAARPEQPVLTLLARLARTRNPSEPGPPGPSAQAIQTVLDETYHALNPDLRRVYRCLGILPTTTITAPLVAAACAITEPAAEHLLEALVDANLIEPTDTGQYRLHDLVHQHAARQAHHRDTPATRATTLRRAVDWALQWATAAETVLVPSHRDADLPRDYSSHQPSPTTPDFTRDDDGQRAALAWLADHQGVLMALVRAAADAGWHGPTWQLVDAMWPLFLRLRLTALWIEAHHIGLDAAQAAVHRAGQARMLTSGAVALRLAERYEEASTWYRQALELARADGNRRDQAQALAGLGNCALAHRRWSEATRHHTQARRLRRSIGYRRGTALSDLSLGEIALAREDTEQAIPLLAHARTDLLALDDRYDAARALAYLTLARSRTGDHATAQQDLHQALAEFEETGSAYWQAKTWEMLGDLTQDTDATHVSYQRAADLFATLSPRDAERVQQRLRTLPTPPEQTHVSEPPRAP